jgi:hypothetical protein
VKRKKRFDRASMWGRQAGCIEMDVGCLLSYALKIIFFEELNMLD